MGVVSLFEPSSGDLLVLVGEDEILIAMDLELLLRRHGWRVLGPVPSVAEVLRLLESGEKPDVALLDVNLRGEMVTPVAEQLQARGVPFVLASAYDSHALTTTVLGGAPNIGKPYNERRLLAALVQATTP